MFVEGSCRTRFPKYPPFLTPSHFATNLLFPAECWSHTRGSVQLRRPCPFSFALPACPPNCREDYVEEGGVDPTSRCPACEAIFRHLTWRAPSDIARGIALSKLLACNDGVHVARAGNVHEGDILLHPVANAAYHPPVPPPAPCGPDGCPLSSFSRYRSPRDRQHLYRDLAAVLLERSPVELVDCYGRTARWTT